MYIRCLISFVLKSSMTNCPTRSNHGVNDALCLGEIIIESGMVWDGVKGY